VHGKNYMDCETKVSKLHITKFTLRNKQKIRAHSLRKLQQK